MTAKEWAERLEKRIHQATFDNETVACILETIAEFTVRIFEKGLNSKEIQIGQYSTKQMLATKNQFVVQSKFKPTQKSSSLVFASSLSKKQVKVLKAESKKASKGKNNWLWIKFKKAKKAVPVMILPGGYKELRQIQGRESGFVNLRYFGELMRDAQGQKLVKTVEGFNYVLKKAINAKKVGWLEEKYKSNGKIFALTKTERKNFFDCCKRNVIAKINA